MYCKATWSHDKRHWIIACSTSSCYRMLLIHRHAYADNNIITRYGLVEITTTMQWIGSLCYFSKDCSIHVFLKESSFRLVQVVRVYNLSHCSFEVPKPALIQLLAQCLLQIVCRWQGSVNLRFHRDVWKRPDVLCNDGLWETIPDPVKLPAGCRSTGLWI